MAESSGSQCVLHSVVVSLGKFLEMQILQPHPDFLNQKIWESVLIKDHTGDYTAPSSLRTTIYISKHQQIQLVTLRLKKPYNIAGFSYFIDEENLL
jgi:hypothetical protein